MELVGWCFAAAVSIPMLSLFHTSHIDDPESIFYNQTVCESVFRHRDPSHRQAFLTFVAIIHVYLPCILICTCYLRIYLKIARKAREASSNQTSTKPGKIHLQSTSSTLPRAKIKTLKMTVVIVSVFLLCGLPYHILESLLNFQASPLPPIVMAIMGALPVANSVLNPFIFLLFNVNNTCLKGLVGAKPRRKYSNKKEQPSHMCQDTSVTAVTEYTDSNDVITSENPRHDRKQIGGTMRAYVPIINLENTEHTDGDT